MHLRIGTRSSPLALKQTEIFVERITKKQNCTFEIIKISTKGDQVLDKPLYDIGGKALFLKELETALLNQEIDLAVHSLKDVPGILDDRFKLACYFGGEYQLDALVSKEYKSILDMPSGSKIATSSPRRISFIKKLRPDLKLEFIRGNIGSRIKKILDEEFDATILAEAGLRRLELWDDKLCSVISEYDIIPAVGQGVIAVETLDNNYKINEILSQISDPILEKKLRVERGFLSELSADCDSPVAAYIQKNNNSIYEGLFMYGKNLESPINILKEEFSDLSENLGNIIAKKIL